MARVIPDLSFLRVSVLPTPASAYAGQLRVTPEGLFWSDGTDWRQVAGILQGNVVYASATGTFAVTADTNDGSDVGQALLSGGGGTGGAARGGYVAVYGNEHAVYPGQVRLVAGTGATRIVVQGASLVPGVSAVLDLGEVAVPWRDAFFSGVVTDGAGNVRKAAAITANAATTLTATHLNRTVEKSNTTAYTYTIDPSIGAQGDIILVVNSGTAGNVTVAGGSGVTLYDGTTTGNVIVAPGTKRAFYLSATANRWIAG